MRQANKKLTHGWKAFWWLKIKKGEKKKKSNQGGKKIKQNQGNYQGFN